MTRLQARREGGDVALTFRVVEGDWPSVPRPIRSWIAEDGDPRTTRWRVPPDTR